MDTISTSPIGLCPINFKAFNALNTIVGSLEETLLLAKIKFHQYKTELKRDRRRVITRSRRDIFSWFGFSPRKTDALLSSLKQKGLLYKAVGTYYGRKQLFLAASDKVTTVPINLSLLDILIEETGSLKAALVYSKIAFGCAHSSIKHKGLTYCVLKKEYLSDWAEISIRTLDSILNKLSRKGLILKKNLVSSGKRQTHFHIPEPSIKVLKRRLNKCLNRKETITPNASHNIKNQNRTSSCKICREEPAKMQSSIKIRTNTKQIINNTTKTIPKQQSNHKESVIKFSLSNFHEDLNPRQISYLKAALQRTIQRYSIKVSSFNELLAQIVFYLTNPQQRKGIKTFQHAVSRCMAILKSGNWSTPYGFYSHDKQGRVLKEQRIQREKKWDDLKRQEISGNESSKPIASIINERINRTEKESFTQKALAVAKRVLRLSKTMESTQNQSALSGVLNSYVSQLQELFCAGANKETVLTYLKTSMI